jgi:hypothetical protein
MKWSADRTVLDVAYHVFVAITVANFLLFVVAAIYLGGDAVNGKVENGRYYVFGSRTEFGRKVHTEVTESVFRYSKWHASSVFITWPLMIAVGCVRHYIRRRSAQRASA